MAARPAGGGRREGPPAQAFRGALSDLSRFLRSRGVRGAVIGGVAVIARGVARFTADVDVAVIPPAGGAREVLRQLAAFGFRPRIDEAERFAEENLVILARHEATEVDVDVSLAHLAFEEAAIGAAEPVTFGGARLPIPRATDLVIYKMVAARPKDLQDVEALVVGGADIDAAVVERTLEAFDELLDLGRAAEWQALLERIRD